ncbi:hypothetical protein RV09_GL002025 [Enterococcus moraviensis]|nr:hypothetical protein RV09_GL002025 [Enterococcus moraviensis]
MKIENAENYVTNPKKIAGHSFLPFIHYVDSFDKYTGKNDLERNNRPIKEKTRKIMYAGHWDNFIYKYYADELLNPKYNEFCLNRSIDDCVTAYRNNKKGKSNIDFAAEVINSIVKYEEAFILVGDFTHFFDSLQHSLLKQRLATVLDVKILSKDWFNVFNSVTKYGYYEKNLLVDLFGTDKQIKKSGRKSYFNQLSDFRKFQKVYTTKTNPDLIKGIPQGTAISAVLANIYTIDFDLALQKTANKYLGIYRRYSDDFILIIPKQSFKKEEFKSIEQQVRTLAEDNKINLHESKTEMYFYADNKIKLLENNKKSSLDYLGFTFDGKTVQMRGKSTYKFYRNAKKLINKAHRTKRKKGLDKIPYRKKIYELYTDIGDKKGKHSNFISYSKQAQIKFDSISPNTNNIMMNQIKNRKKYVEKRLGFKIHTNIRTRDI